MYIDRRSQGHSTAADADLIAVERAVQRELTGARAASGRVSRWRRLAWAGARLGFYGYTVFAMVTLVGGFLTAPLMTKLFFDDWRCWRYLRPGARLLPHAWRLFAMMLRGEGRFMLGVPLASAPRSAPRRRVAALAPAWDDGASCGSCQRCCHVKSLRCPLLDSASGRCTGYDAFYWRYFNCGRYPSSQADIDYYGCPKWEMRSPRR